MRYKYKTVYVWSSPVAYSVGLMASDGCLLSDGRHLDLTSSDISQLENFCKALGKNLKISAKLNSARQQSFRVQFSDAAYYDFLLKVGLTPNKSRTLAKLNVPEKYYGHFLRGLFDGDGTTYGYYDPRWEKSFLFYTGFASASMRFLEYVSKTNQDLIKVKGSSIRKSSRAFSLTYGKADSYLLYEAMYTDTSTLFLARKKKKLERFIMEDKNATILRHARVVKLVNTQP